MVSSSAHLTSPFLNPGACAQADSLSNLHLKRDLQLHVLLREEDDQEEGYDEGKVTNTRFGSFPHSTLIGVPWGSQIRASAVDTGSRGRRGPNGRAGKGQKRKRETDTPNVSTPHTEDGIDSAGPKSAAVASTGFVHLLPPTPESWTISLPHRTQIVYTADYSYILQRLRARPGTVIIEAGAGSGSFTHAAARAVFSGYPQEISQVEGEPARARSTPGKVWSFEFHSQRVNQLQAEVRGHGLDGVVQVTHRDVCDDGFMVETGTAQLVHADAVFLDLPAPWLALKHLSRQSTNARNDGIPKAEHANLGSQQPEASNAPPPSPLSPLNPSSPVRICTFSPCIEQVQRTVATLRERGWTEIETVEIAAKRIVVRRERVGLQEEGLRGGDASPASVDEAVGRLRQMEQRAQTFHHDNGTAESAKANGTSVEKPSFVTKQQRLADIRDAQADRRLYKEGRLLHRVEQQIRTHTSYLVFAILPQEWTPEDEARAQERWTASQPVAPGGRGNHLSRRQRKKNANAEVSSHH